MDTQLLLLSKLMTETILKITVNILCLYKTISKQIGPISIQVMENFIMIFRDSQDTQSAFQLQTQCMLADPGKSMKATFKQYI